MIIKELESFASEDPILKAGRSAEETMAFYLRRTFGDDRDLLVFHGLRLELDGDAAQMDHLLLHRHGTILIVSKSVAGRVEINEHGEWMRWYGRGSKGMPSPILQAQRQGEFLKRYLNPHAEALRNKILGILQARFGAMPISVLVAISDSGIVQRPKRPVPEVHKADEIPTQVRTVVQEHRRMNSLFNLNMSEGGYALSREELDRLSSFLLLHHKPWSNPAVSAGSQRPVSAVPPASPPVIQPPPPLSSPAVWGCRHCKGSTIRIEYGRYGYYFKCQSCQGNTPLHVSCAACGAKERTRKSGSQFFRECESCATSELFYTNPAS